MICSKTSFEWITRALRERMPVATVRAVARAGVGRVRVHLDAGEIFAVSKEKYNMSAPFRLAQSFQRPWNLKSSARCQDRSFSVVTTKTGFVCW
jgi:hypothetical protein